MQPLRLGSCLLAIVTGIGWGAAARAELQYIAGHYYTANYNSQVITQYNSALDVVGTFTVDPIHGTGVHGLAFGPDNLLYAVLGRPGVGTDVIAITSSGVVQQTYTSTVFMTNLSHGKIAVDSQYIYMAALNRITRFQIGNPTSATTIYSRAPNSVFDVEIMPNGNLLVASDDYVDEIAPDGSLVRTVSHLQYLTLRGVEYDPATDKIFIADYGNTWEEDRVVQIDAVTGAMEGFVESEKADDLFLTISGELLVGSRDAPPRLYTNDLNLIGTLGSDNQIFVTQYTGSAVPEPSTYALLLVGGATVWGATRRRKRPANI